EMGCVVKLLAICALTEPTEGGERSVSVRVHPAMIPHSHPLATVRGPYNAVFTESRSAGRLMFTGPGAGGPPTASAVLGDLVTVCRNRLRGAAGPGESSYAQRKISPIGEVITRYHLSLDVADVAGVLARIAQVFADYGVSIQTVRQQVREGQYKERGDRDHNERAGRDSVGRTERDAKLVIVTHRATDAALSATVQALHQLDVVNEVTSVMRVEGE
ncbi:MAG TPA: ACT domain-containing protein, partial [Microlunatus sp.]